MHRRGVSASGGSGSVGMSPAARQQLAQQQQQQQSRGGDVNRTVTVGMIAGITLVLYLAASPAAEKQSTPPAVSSTIVPAAETVSPPGVRDHIDDARNALRVQAQELKAAQDRLKELSHAFMRGRGKAMVDAAEAKATTARKKSSPPSSAQKVLVLDDRAPTSAAPEANAAPATPADADADDTDSNSAPAFAPSTTVAASDQIPERVVSVAGGSGPLTLGLACHTRRVPAPETRKAFLDRNGVLIVPVPATHPPELAHVTTPFYTLPDDARRIARVDAWPQPPLDDVCADAIAKDARAAEPSHLAAVRDALVSPLQLPKSGWASAVDGFNQSESAIARLVQVRDIQHRPGARPLATKRVPTAPAVAACVDPRYPLRLPMMLLPFGDPVLDPSVPDGPAVLPCYGTGDLVCDTLRTVGAWESDVIALVHEALAGVVEERSRRLAVYLRAVANAASGPQQQHDDSSRGKAEAAGHAAVAAAMRTFNPADADADSTTDAGASSSSSRRGPKASFDVEYVDIGANVGAFLLHFWRHGYPVTAFEALPFNMQLLSSSLCLNGVRAPMDLSKPATDADGGDVFGDKRGPPVRIHHTALGRERDVRCVMMSEDLNFGDTWISCNATHVAHTASEFPFQQYRRRGYVNMTTLDAFFFATGAAANATEHAADATGGSSSTDSEEDAPQQHRATGREAALAAGLASLGVAVEDAGSMKKLREVEAAANMSGDVLLPADFLSKDYVLKIDVEGHEVAVFEGAARLLADPMVRPRLVVSEVWLNLNMTRYAELMFAHGYVGWSVAFRLRMGRMAAVKQFNRMRAGQDTVVWVERRWEGILIPRLIAPRKVARPRHGGGSGGSGALGGADDRPRDVARTAAEPTRLRRGLNEGSGV